MNKLILRITLILMIAAPLFSQQNSYYDAGLNLPFNKRTGDVNPQTGNLSMGASNVALPGRAAAGYGR